MIDPKALEKLVENGISIVSFKDGDISSARMIRNARVEPDGRVSFEPRKDTRLGEYLQNTDAFTLSVLMEKGLPDYFEDLFSHFDTDMVPHRVKFLGLDRYIEKQKNDLYAVTHVCTNAIISCRIDEIVKSQKACRVFGTVVESQLLHDEPSMTEEYYRNTLRKEFNPIYECDRCGMRFSLSPSLGHSEEPCINCGGTLCPLPWWPYSD